MHQALYLARHPRFVEYLLFMNFGKLAARLRLDHETYSLMVRLIGFA